MRFAKHISRVKLLIAAVVVIGGSLGIPSVCGNGGIATASAQQLVLQAIPVPFLPVWVCSGECKSEICCYIGPF